jgi:hypothetical protein
MLALVNTPSGKAPVELRQVPDPAPGLHEALVAVKVFRSIAASCDRSATTRRAGYPARTSAALCCGKRRTAAVRRLAHALSR